MIPVRVKRVLIVITALLVVVGASCAAFRWQEHFPSVGCQICGRVIPKETAFQRVAPHGTLRACCRTCAMHFMINHPGLVRKALATDFTLNPSD